MSRLKRYNEAKRGSFQISLEFYDWELSTIIGALRAFRKNNDKNKAYVTFLMRLEKKFSQALGEVLKAEFRDLKLGETKPLKTFDSNLCPQCGDLLAINQETNLKYCANCSWKE